ncbi:MULTISPECIES: autotransporter-associated beta strand repeat-containing protein [Rhodopseudomonas]|uniref:autotransporter-associated beta strand repeat-containing protein n=1 Tax=Rhodopseudomonas TaxID=1073 RepID=UPI00069630D6|nr:MULTISPECIES: autotransporter-associated beta strand repeat-containing protein [Rhodopseudomonas]MDF3812806.1 autotransporter-associated beta strand repeat-containing protein [Rhodopseudomonas sp. BAL398]WOK15675.1 autotransporter-associated beta strand repeat-containing protein [Rhodopseudomonas sp. BAL398]
MSPIRIANKALISSSIEPEQVAVKLISRKASTGAAGIRAMILRGLLSTTAIVGVSAAVVFATHANEAAAQTATWIGATSTYLDDANWTGGTAPVAAGRSATFTNTGDATVNVGSAIAPDSWIFNTNALNYAISGAAVNFGGTGITNNATGNISIANAIGGTGGVTQAGTGILTLSGANTYTGSTMVTGGTLNVAGTLGRVTLGGGTTLHVSPGGTINTATGPSVNGTGTFTIVNLGAITNTTGSNINTNGTVALITGSGSTLSSGQNEAFAAAGAGSSIVNAAGATIRGGSDTQYGRVYLGNSASVTNYGTLAGSATLASGGNTSGALVVGTNSTVNLRAGSTTGNVRLGNGSTLSLYNGSGTAGAGNTTIDPVTGATITLQTAGTNAAATVGTIAFGTGGTLALRGTGDGTAANGVTGAWNIANLGGATTLSKQDSGTFVLTGSYGGALATNVIGGRLVASNTAGAFGTGAVAISTGATVELSNTTANSVIELPGLAFSGAGTLEKTGAGIVSIGGITQSSIGFAQGGLINVVAGTLRGSTQNHGIWSGNNAGLTIASGATFDGVEGTIRVDALNGAGTLQGGPTTTIGVANGSGVFTGVIQNSIYAGGTFALTKAGTGTQTLSGTSTYTGATTIAGGALRGGAASSFSANSAFTVGSGAFLDLGGFNETIGSLGGAGTVTNSGTNAQLSAGGLNQSSTFSGVIQNGAGTVGLVKSGTGTLTLTGANTYTGGTSVSAGTLQIGTNGSLAGNIVDNATLAFNRPDAVTFAGVVSGSGTLNQTGAGSTTLTGVNSVGNGQFTGTANVNAGTLAINGTFGDTAGNTALVNVNNGGTLHGSGTVAGSVVVASGGFVSAGNSPGTLTVAQDYTLAAGSTSLFELGTPGVVGGTDNDLINVGRNLTLGGTLSAVSSADGAASPVAGEYRLYTYGGTLTGAFASVATPTAQSATVFTNVAGQVNLLVANAGQNLQYWDGADTTGAAAGGQGGTGNWTAANTNWTASPTSQVDNAWRSGVGIFGGTAGTVTITGAQSVQGLQFTADGYQLAGAGTLNLTGDAFSTVAQSFINVDAGVGVSIANALTSTGGTFGLVKIGTGSLTLSGANTYTGLTTVSNGTLAIAAGGSITSDVSNAATFNNAGTVTGTFANAGTASNSGVITGATTQSAGSLSNTGALRGTLGLTGGSFTNATGGSVVGATTNAGGTVTNNGGTLAAVTNSSGTFANNSGTAGAVINSATATNAGTVASLTNNSGTFANTGTITGATTVSGGAFTTSGTLGGGLTNSATVTANGGAVNGAIANNAGAFNVGGTVTSNNRFANASGATLAVTGTGSYTLQGLLTNAGLLTIANGGQLNATAGGLTNTGTVTVAQGGTLRDDLNNAGTVTNNGNYIANVAFTSGSIANTASGTWTGNVLSNSGSLSNSGTWTGSIVTSGTFTNAAGGTVSGLVTNSGTTTNAGTFNGGLANTAGTTINNGVINGPVTLSGGSLTGSGRTGNLIASSGAFAPGNGTPGSSMTVNGNLALASAVQYVVQVNPATASFTSVTGTAALGGAAVTAHFARGSYVTQQYTIVAAAGGRTGTFGALTTTNLPANFNANVSYDANRAFLDLTLDYTRVGGLNRNQQNVANTLTGYFNRTGGIPMAFGSLSASGLSQVSGELGTGTQQTTFDAMGLFMGLMTDPSSAGRSTAPQRAIGYADESRRAPRDAFAAMSRKAPEALQFEQRWNVWSAGFGGSQTTDGNAATGSGTASSRIYGGAAGADYRISPNTTAGFALAGGGTNFSVANGGSGRSDLFQAGGFVRHSVGATYLTAALAYGWQDVTTERSVGVDRLGARFTSNALSGRVETGSRFDAPWIDGAGLTPYAAAQFTTVYLPSYGETAGTASTFGLNYAARDVTASRSELGLRSDRSFGALDGVMTLRGRAAWAHNFNPDRSVNATFQTLPGAGFVVNGAAQAREAALVTASAEMAWRNGWTVAGTFEGEFSKVTSSYAGKGVVRYGW